MSKTDLGNEIMGGIGKTYQTTGLEVTQGGSELVSGWPFYFPDMRKQLECWRLPTTPILWVLRCLAPASVLVSTAASIAHGECTGPETMLLIFVVSALDKGDAS